MKFIVLTFIHFILLSLSGINIFSCYQTKKNKDLIFSIISVSALISFYFYLILK
jgi:hypothetical protein